MGSTVNALIKISQKLNKGSVEKITILTSDLSFVPDNVRKNVKVLVDKDTGYENIGIPMANIAMIKSSKGKIVKIQMINLDDTDKIVNEEF
jgi:hypothetical protein